jgi:hypothetical protein
MQCYLALRRSRAESERTEMLLPASQYSMLFGLSANVHHCTSYTAVCTAEVRKAAKPLKKLLHQYEYLKIESKCRGSIDCVPEALAI